MIRSLAIAAMGALVLAGCEQQAPQGTTPEAAQPTQQNQTQQQAAAPANGADEAPRIFMALQADPNGPTSIIFAIDRAKDNTPLNDPAIRLTPEEGACNPQELRGYPFPLGSSQRPVFGPQEVSSGVTARELPNFMAMAVTSEMMRQGIVVTPQQSKPQNVCTRKLWEQLIINQSAG
ncbi:MAG: hypothetical protein AB8B85_02335 [Paracoccaceae bacterium]